MKTIMALSFAAIVLAGSVSNTSAQVNGLDNRSNVKVMRAKRMQAIQNRKENKEETSNNTKQNNGCGGVEIGNVETGRGARATAPRENTVVVTGDVIVVPGRHCN